MVCSALLVTIPLKLEIGAVTPNVEAVIDDVAVVRLKPAGALMVMPLESMVKVFPAADNSIYLHLRQ